MLIFPVSINPFHLGFGSAHATSDQNQWQGTMTINLSMPQHAIMITSTGSGPFSFTVGNGGTISGTGSINQNTKLSGIYEGDICSGSGTYTWNYNVGGTVNQGTNTANLIFTFTSSQVQGQVSCQGQGSSFNRPMQNTQISALGTPSVQINLNQDASVDSPFLGAGDLKIELTGTNSPSESTVSPQQQSVIQANQQTTNNSIQSSNLQIPFWIKNNAKWWSQGQIEDSEFIKGIQYLMQQGIITIPQTTLTSTTQSNQIPGWIKNNAGWWGTGQISDGEFIKGLQYLISNGIINPNNANTQQQNTTVDLDQQCQTNSGPNYYYDTSQNKCLPIGGSSGVIAQPQVQVTDSKGMVYFQINGQSAPFRFHDNMGLPIQGLDVGFALDRQTQSIGVILAIDPNNKYPLQMVLVHGQYTSSSITPSDWGSSQIPLAYAESSENQNYNPVNDVVVGAGTRVVEGIAVVGLGPVTGHDVEEVLHISDATNLVVGLLGSRGGPAGQVISYGATPESLNYGNALTKIVADSTGKLIGTVIVITVAAPAIAIVGGTATAGTAIAFAMGATIYDVTELTLNSINALNCDKDGPVMFTPFIPTRSEVISCQSPANNKPLDSVYWSNHNPFKTSLDLISRTDLGYDVHCEADPNTSISCPAEAFDYFASISAPGMSPVTKDVSVSQGQATSLDVSLQPISTENNNQNQNNGDASALIQEGVDLMNQGKYQDAINDFDKALKIDPNNFDAYSNGCYSYGMLANFQVAKGYCSEALKIDPNNVNALINEGWALDRIGYFDEAARYFSQAMKLDPSNTLAQQNYQAAISHQNIEQVISNPQSSSNQHLSSTLSEAGDLTGAYSGSYNANINLGQFGNCPFSGPFQLSLQKTGDNTYFGTLTSSIGNGGSCQAENMGGTLSENISITTSSSGFSGSGSGGLGDVSISGSFTSSFIRFHISIYSDGATGNYDFTGSR